jgi:hypothetical protein
VTYSNQFSIVSAGSGAKQNSAASGAVSATTTTLTKLEPSTASTPSPTLKITATSLSTKSLTISSSSVTSASASISIPASPSTPNTKQGLSSGTVAGIGVGCTLEALILLALVIFAVLFIPQKSLKKGVAREETGIAELASGTKSVAELGSGKRLNEEEMEELQRRKWAAELEDLGSKGAELCGERNSRAELEALREKARVAYEKEA